MEKSKFKDFVERNRDTIKLGVIGAAIGAGGALLLYGSFRLGVKTGVFSLGKVVYEVLEKSEDYKGALDLIEEALINYTSK